MNDLASLNGRPRRLEVDGETYEIHPLQLDDLGDLQCWVDSQFRNPYEMLAPHLHRMPIDAQRYALKVATEESRKPTPKLGTPEADALVQSIDGIKEMIYISICKGRPEFTRDQAKALYRKFGMDQVADLFATTGVVAPGDGGGPKAGTPGATTTTTS